MTAGTQDVTFDVLATLSWLIQDANFRREQTGLDPAPLSPEMQLAEKLLRELQAGRIECRRIA